MALLELHEITTLANLDDYPTFNLVATAFTILVGSVSFSGSVVTFLKLQEVMTTRPVVFPGLPVAFGLALLGGVALSVWMVADPALAPGVVLALVLMNRAVDLDDPDLSAEEIDDVRTDRMLAAEAPAVDLAPA